MIVNDPRSDNTDSDSASTRLLVTFSDGLRFFVPLEFVEVFSRYIGISGDIDTHLRREKRLAISERSSRLNQFRRHVTDDQVKLREVMNNLDSFPRLFGDVGRVDYVSSRVASLCSLNTASEQCRTEASCSSKETPSIHKLVSERVCINLAIHSPSKDRAGEGSASYSIGFNNDFVCCDPLWLRFRRVRNGVRYSMYQLKDRLMRPLNIKSRRISCVSLSEQPVVWSRTANVDETYTSRLHTRNFVSGDALTGIRLPILLPTFMICRVQRLSE